MLLVPPKAGALSGGSSSSSGPPGGRVANFYASLELRNTLKRVKALKVLCVLYIYVLHVE